MKIAVASQNKRKVTGHTGRCRRFWLFEVNDGEIADKTLLELPEELTFHESGSHGEHPLDDVDVLICGGMGQGLAGRLQRKRIEGVVTAETDPDTAVRLYLDGMLITMAPHDHSHDDDHHHHHHHEA